MELRCLRCGNQASIELTSVHEPDRVCWDCKAPWVPADYQGDLIAEDTTVTPPKARLWLSQVPDDAGHWTLSRPEIVRRYANLMRTGQWQDRFLPDVANPIGFDCHGVLLSGLCRLIACVDANESFGAVVVRFDPIVPGHVNFDWGYQRRRRARLLGYWQSVA